MDLEPTLEAVAAAHLHDAAVTKIAHDNDPFKVLISCLISLRTKDEVTAVSSARLFAKAASLKSMSMLTPEEIGELIYPCGFYRRKGEQIFKLVAILVGKYQGSVPAQFDQLLALPGVGVKTANLVLGLGFGIPAICVDTHVHRICNRWGVVNTKTPEQTVQALETTLPLRWWIPINNLLVQFGRMICQPRSPLCTHCPVSALCPRFGVTYSR